MKKTLEFYKKECYNFVDLVNIMFILRGPNGCPWDKEQSHSSVRNNFIEEVYEAVDAIDKSDWVNLCEELGDVLLQVVFHSNMAEEANRFTIDQVTDGICRKLIRRHPHIFSDVSVSSSQEVLKNWDAIKISEKGQATVNQTLSDIAKSLPALMRAHKIQAKAAKVGFDWDNISGALEKLDEEIIELKEALKSNNQKNIEDELGDVLFSAVNVSRFAKIEPEQALSRTCEKFISRFSIMEELASKDGMNLNDMSLKQLDQLWDNAKLRLI